MKFKVVIALIFAVMSLELGAIQAIAQPGQVDLGTSEQIYHRRAVESAHWVLPDIEKADLSTISG